MSQGGEPSDRPDGPLVLALVRRAVVAAVVARLDDHLRGGLWASLLLSPPWSTWLSSSENESFDPAALLMLPRLCLLLLLPASVWSPGRFAACTLTPARC